jgi:hypothetical protein
MPRGAADCAGRDGPHALGPGGPYMPDDGQYVRRVARGPGGFLSAEDRRPS